VAARGAHIVMRGGGVFLRGVASACCARVCDSFARRRTARVCAAAGGAILHLELAALAQTVALIVVWPLPHSMPEGRHDTAPSPPPSERAKVGEPERFHSLTLHSQRQRHQQQQQAACARRARHRASRQRSRARPSTAAFSRRPRKAAPCLAHTTVLDSLKLSDARVAASLAE
jgi:hypothetical protein